MTKRALLQLPVLVSAGAMIAGLGGSACGSSDDDTTVGAAGTSAGVATCSPEGAIEGCYPGEPATLNVGACRAGNRMCSSGTWTGCSGYMLPSGVDYCGDGVDDDCNGLADDHCDCGDTATAADNCGSCGHHCLGGTCVGGRCQPFALVTGLTSPAMLALREGRLYWSSWAATGGILAIDAGGGSPEVIVGSVDSPLGVWLDPPYLYYASTTLDAVFRKLLDTAEPPEQFDTGNGASLVVTDDATVYWTDYDAGNIKSRAKTGGSGKTLASYRHGPLGLCVGSGSLYWTDEGSESQGFVNGRVEQRMLGSGTNVDVALDQLAPQRIVAYGDFVYWTNLGTGTPPAVSGGALVRNGVLGNPETALAITGEQAGPVGLAIDESGIYWVNRYGGTVMWLGLGAAGDPTVLASEQGEPFDIALGPDAIYWTDMAAGRIVKLAK